MEKILTVSIAGYKQERYIRRALDSLCVADVVDDLEVFVIDNDSPDNVLSIAQEYEKKYPNTFHAIHKINGGYGSTINYSLSNANGKYFKLLDGDDWFCSENLAAFIHFLKNQTADIILSPYYQVFNGQKEILIENKVIFETEQKLEKVSFHSILTMHEMCVKTSLLKRQNKKITENCLYTDYEYVFLSLLASETIFKFPLPIYCYQIGIAGQSVSIEGIRNNYLDKSKVAWQMYEWYESQSENTHKGLRKQLYIHELFGITDDAYSSYMTLQDTKKGKRELISFDLNIKQTFPEIYKMTMSIKKIRLLRKTKFLAFHFLRNRYLKTFEN